MTKDPGSGPWCAPIRKWDDAVAIVQLLDRKKWNTAVKLANAIFEYLEIWHNRKRRPSQLGWLTPIEFERNRIITAA